MWTYRWVDDQKIKSVGFRNAWFHRSAPKLLHNVLLTYRFQPRDAPRPPAPYRAHSQSDPSAADRPPMAWGHWLYNQSRWPVSRPGVVRRTNHLTAMVGVCSFHCLASAGGFLTSSGWCTGVSSPRGGDKSVFLCLKGFNYTKGGVSLV